MSRHSPAGSGVASKAVVSIVEPENYPNWRAETRLRPYKSGTPLNRPGLNLTCALIIGDDDSRRGHLAVSQFERHGNSAVCP